MITKSSFEDDLHGLLLEKKYEEILQFLKDPQNESLVESNAWNLVSRVCIALKTNKILERESDLVLCGKILLQIVDRGSPREMVVALMEEADCFKEHSFFVLLLDPLKQTLKRVPTRRGKSLEWVMSTLNAHLQSLPPPPSLDLQGEERLLLDATPEVVDANFVLTNYFSFVDSFVEEVSYAREETSDDDSERQRETLRRYILKVLYHPLLFHDLHVEDESRPKNTTRVLCENFVRCLSKVCRNVFDLYKYDRSDESDEETVSALAFANLSYLIFVENLAVDFQPFVYAHHYVFMSNLKYMELLLTESHPQVLLKGLLLVQLLLGRLQELEIAYSCVEVNLYCVLSRLLLNIAVHCQVKEHRQIAVQNFMSYISRCDCKARYHLILQVVCTVDHSGCFGMAVDLFKNNLHHHLDREEEDSPFLGRNLKHFMRKVFVLQEGAETDLLENHDKIVSSLNFLRYLLLRDPKDEDRTGVWAMSGELSVGFLGPLSEAINLSRAHYMEAAKQTELDRRCRKEKDTVTVNGTVLPNTAWKEMSGKALLNFDILESVLSRVHELME